MRTSTTAGRGRRAGTAAVMATVVAAVWGWGGLASPAAAEPITFRFEGTVQIDRITRAPWGSASVGTPATLEYTFESNTPDAAPNDPEQGTYQDAVGAWTLSIGATTQSGSGGRIIVTNPSATFLEDRYQVRGMLLPGGFEMNVFLYGDSAGGPLSSKALPTRLTLSQWEERSGNLIDTVNNVGIIINWTSLTITTYPPQACCNPSTGACALTTGAAACRDLGGVPIADATACTPALCPPPTGACCRGPACTVTTQAACAGGSHPGAWLGGGTTCEPVPGVNPCCRADHDHNGAVSVADIFTFLRAWFAGCP